MNHDLVIEGKAFLQDSFKTCCIGIDNGKITEIKKILKGDRKQTFSKKYILPAGVDVHVHFREPGMSNKETVETGSLAALHGGISCFFDMPNTIPPTTTPQRLLDKLHHTKEHTYVDFGLYYSINEDNYETLDTVHHYSSGYKIFLGETTKSSVISPSLLSSIFSKLERSRKPILFHAEDSKCLQIHAKEEQSLYDHHQCRPPLCETLAIQRTLQTITNQMPPIHICHVSSKEGLHVLKNPPFQVSYGVTPHHVLLSIDEINHPETWYKVNPPLRPSQHSQALFQAIKQNQINIIESDHAPHQLTEKEQDFQQAPAGIPGVETMYPLFLALAIKKHLSFQQVILLLCVNPAKLTNTPKGNIIVGNDADIIIVDPRDQRKISIEQLHSKAEWTPFLNWDAVFPSDMFVRGQQVLDSHELSCSPGAGCHVEEKNYHND
jgi:dihydroorotase